MESVQQYVLNMGTLKRRDSPHLSLEVTYESTEFEMDYFFEPGNNSPASPGSLAFVAEPIGGQRFLPATARGLPRLCR